MNKIFRVIQYEVITTLTRPSYLLISFVIPIIGLLIFLGFSLIRDREPDSQAADIQLPGTELKVEGFVDQAGLIKLIPPDLPSEILLPFSDERSAQEAIEADEISAYYIIPPDYLDSGELIYVHPELSTFSSSGQDWVMRWTLVYNLSGGDAELASMVWNPADIHKNDLSIESTASQSADGACLRPGPSCQTNALLSLLPIIILVLFFVFISGGSGLLLRNVINEKQNRTIEILMLAISPRQMFVGKLTGLGLLSIFQTLFWIGSGFAILKFGGSTLNLPPEFSIPNSILIWGGVFFVLGYALYASLMAGVGALVPDIKASSQASFIVISPLLVGYFIALLPPVQNSPNGMISTLLSLIPFTSPVVMMVRLVIVDVPTWQLLLAVGLLIVTVILSVRAVARMFRAQTLLSGQPFSPKLYFQALTGKT